MISQWARKWITSLSKKRSRQGLYEFLRMEFQLIAANARVLIIGAGGQINQVLLDVSKERHFSVSSMDIDPAKRPDIIGDICTYEIGTEQYDVVVLSEVLEHAHAPHLAMEKIRQCLKPGGRLVLSTPFMLPMHDRPHDYFRFTRYGLELLLSAFKNVEIMERNSYFEAIDVLWMRLVQEKTPLWACLIMIPFIYSIKRPLTLCLGRVLPVDGMTTGYVAHAFK